MATTGLRSARSYAGTKGEAYLRQFDALHDQLFEGTMDFSGAGQLWLKYMAFTVEKGLRAFVGLLAVMVLCRVLEDGLDMLPTSWHLFKYVLTIMGVDVG